MRKIVFICQVSETVLKLIKFQATGNNSGGSLLAAEIEPLAYDIDEPRLAQQLSQALKKLGYKNNPVVLSLVRRQATCRYLKVPTQAPSEIEKIIALQSSIYLPYPANELITGYQVISVDREGYSHINLVIVHKDNIERYTRIFKELKITNFSIVLSSYGLCNLYSYIKPQEASPVMLVDIDSNQVELAIIFNKKLLFSRYFKLSKLAPNWEQALIDELNKTNDAYLKEVAGERPQKIIILGAALPQETAALLNRQIASPVESVFYDKNISIPENILQAATASGHSLAGLIGLGLAQIPESLNLVSADIREESRKALKYKENLRLILFVCGVVIILLIASAKNLNNKEQYLGRINSELNKIAKEAKFLEEVETRFRIFKNKGQKNPSSLDILYELHRITPDRISLTSLNYEEGNQLVLRGQTVELESVFMFVSQLEKGESFKGFNIKVTYATRKKIQAAEIVDFEIACVKTR